MVDFRAELAALVAAYDNHRKWTLNPVFKRLHHAVEHARAVLNEPAAIEFWHVPRALSDEALRLLTSLPMDEIERRLRVPMAADGEAIEGQLITGWLPIDTAPRDGTEILASDYDAIEIVSWGERQAWEGRSDRDGRMMLPSWWQPLPDHPPLPEVE